MSPRTGRPPIDNAKGFLLQVRIDQETKKQLDQCVKERGTTRSEVVREGIKKVAQETEKK